MASKTYFEESDEISADIIEKSSKQTKKRVRKVGNWSNEENERLIVEVKKRELLWNHTAADYKDKHKRQLAWDKISETVGKSAFLCRTRWDVIRNSFRITFQKMQAIESGSLAGTCKKTQFYEMLHFLIPMLQIQTKPKESNFDTDSRTFDTTEDTLGAESMVSDNADESVKATTSTAAEKPTEKCTAPTPAAYPSLKRKAPFVFPRKYHKRMVFQLNKNPGSVASNGPNDPPKNSGGIQFSNRVQKDDSAAYGDYIASKHRKYSEHTKSVLEHLIAELLYNADMGRYEVDSNSMCEAAASEHGDSSQETTMFADHVVKEEQRDPLTELHSDLI